MATDDMRPYKPRQKVVDKTVRDTFILTLIVTLLIGLWFGYNVGLWRIQEAEPVIQAEFPEVMTA